MVCTIRVVEKQVLNPDPFPPHTQIQLNKNITNCNHFHVFT